MPQLLEVLEKQVKKENNQLVSNTTQLKLTAADGKKYMTDTLDMECVVELTIVFLGNG